MNSKCIEIPNPCSGNSGNSTVETSRRTGVEMQQQRSTKVSVGFFCTGLVSMMLLVGCTPTENAQLVMCKNVTTNLAGKVASWDKTDISERTYNMTVKASYTLSGGGSGTVSCLYDKDNFNSNGTDPVFQTAPSKVTLNGEVVGQRELVKAGLKATGEQLSDVAAETSKQATALAKETSKKAGELAEQVDDLSAEATRKSEALAAEAGQKAKEFGDKAVKATKDAAEKVQEAIQSQ